MEQNLFLVHYLYLISVWIHILSAMVWIGGMVFLVVVVVPVLKKPAFREVYPVVFHLTGVRFRLVGWISLTSLVITGISNLAFRGYHFVDLPNGGIFQGTFGHMLRYKLLLVLIVLVSSAVHDFWIGPRATSYSKESPGSSESRLFRLLAAFLGRVNLIFSILIVAFAVILVRGIG